MPHRFPTRAPAADQAPGRVLVVDDDESVRWVIAEVLAAGGHAADTAGGTDEALRLLREREYDVALVDLIMPGRSGLDLLDAMAAAGADVLPVLLTGTTDVGAAVAGMKRGAFDYVPKPIDPDAVLWTVGRAVRIVRARRRERALERVAAEWAATFDACPDLLLVLAPDGAVLRANEAVVRRLGGAPAVGRPVHEVFAGPVGAAIRSAATGPRAGEALAGVRLFDPVLGGHFLVTASPIRSAAGRRPEVVVVARDVTEMVRAEELRGRLLRQLLTAQEDERGRIARELHDGIGQELASLAVGLAAVAAAVEGDARERAERLGQVAAEALEETRRMAHGLRPTALDDLGLVAALARLTDGFARVHGVRVELIIPEPRPDRLPPEVESAVYRIVQEALANVARHARARTADVVVEAADGSVLVAVTDDGVGFAADERPAGDAGLGLSGMRERAVLLGGEFRVVSAPGRGTTVQVRIPLAGGVR